MPPIENADIPLARRRPLTYAANFDPSGWNAAIPSPETTASATTSQYEGASAASAIPTPATTTPAGASQSAPRRSEKSPNSGCTTDEAAVDASIRPATSVYESEKRSLKYGNRAGSAPPAKSVPRCPPDSSTIARRSISARIRARVPRRDTRTRRT